MSGMQNFSDEAARFGRWYRQGVLLWLRAPVRLGLANAVILLVEFLVQMIPTIGTLVSKPVVSVLAAAMWFAYADLFAGHRFGWDVVARTVRQSLAVWCALVVVGYVVFAVQVGVTTAFYGPETIDAVVWGHFDAHPQFETLSFVVALIPAGSIPDTMLLLVAPLLLLRQVSPARAFFQSIAAFFHWSVAFGLLVLFGAAVTAISVVLFPLLLVSLPLLGAIGFAAYADVFGLQMAPSRESSRWPSR